ncbi:carbohydrate ABC transporter permease [Pisciglobus halotolerans]|uniref:Carbohydrate ABC transporter membrane protein 2, CUT1 family n=1 Tax=Pisciglobus halotolerans TaxID=745365 RepID=A0A1I3DED4_9LACT|nr:carbohydrate ABC transporter permease [Pisciglobus halotolerans]SFH85075.1 carbohydrate ABC transporter membrane protein 2, CUT1 family [Pisciglobus halotolerans]
MRKANKWHTYIVIFLGTLLSITWLYPFILIFVNSFKTRSEIFTNTLSFPLDPTSENYPRAFAELDYVQSFTNSLLITVVSIILIVFFTSMAAYALSRYKRKMSSFIYFICGATMLIPFQSVMIPLVGLFGKVSLLNRTGLIIMNIGFSSSMSIFLYYGALRAIPIALDEAAIIEGANRFQIFFRVIFPMLRSTTVTVIILNAIKIWNDYLLPSLVVNKDGMYTLPLQMYYFFGQYTTQWELALAGLILAIIPIIILYIFLQKYIVEGITEGAVK